MREWTGNVETFISSFGNRFVTIQFFLCVSNLGMNICLRNSNITKQSFFRTSTSVSKWSKTKEVTRFLKQHSCDTLILCGDIIDGAVASCGGKTINGGGATRILSRCYWTSLMTRRLFMCGEIMMISWIE